MARRCFYSFHFAPDNWRAAMVRNIGSIEGNQPASDNEWESITSGNDKDQKIRNWIAAQMNGKTCTVVLVGANTADRKWITYEIVKSWNDGLGVVGIYIHGLKGSDGLTSTQGANPFEYVNYNPTKQRLSSIVKCYNPAGADSRQRYDWIATHLANAVEEAVKIRQSNS